MDPNIIKRVDQLIKLKLLYPQICQPEAERGSIRPIERVSKQRLLVEERNASLRLLSGIAKLVIVPQSTLNYSLARVLTYYRQTISNLTIMRTKLWRFR